MAERECLACGVVSAGELEVCGACGGRHFALLSSAAQRRPPPYGPGDHAALMYSSELTSAEARRAELLGAAMGHELLSTRDRVHVCA